MALADGRIVVTAATRDLAAGAYAQLESRTVAAAAGRVVRVFS
jgi:hypothetical protein